MCEIAENLRTEWYKHTYPLNASSTEHDKELAMKQRETPEYRAAMDALREHFIECEVCRKEQERRSH
jgi:hypothetical protein